MEHLRVHCQWVMRKDWLRSYNQELWIPRLFSYFLVLGLIVKTMWIAEEFPREFMHILNEIISQHKAFKNGPFLFSNTMSSWSSTMGHHVFAIVTLSCKHCFSLALGKTKKTNANAMWTNQIHHTSNQKNKTFSKLSNLEVWVLIIKKNSFRYQNV